MLSFSSFEVIGVTPGSYHKFLQIGIANAIIAAEMALAMPIIHNFGEKLRMNTIKRIFQDQSRSFFLFGPRGVGKSTWMKSQYQNALWIDLLDPQTSRNFVARPERLFDLVNANPSQDVVVIDEVQKVPALLSIVHSLIEKKQGIKFVLSGSSARKLKQTSADLLGGRALKCNLHPFIASELGDMFSLDDALLNGMLPLVYKQQDA